jgi:hypothetical protein
MLASARYRFLYIHVPKTAGRSLRRALRPYSDLRGGHFAAWGRKLGLVRPLPDWQSSLTDHATARQIRDAAPAEFFQTAFKFAVVRNPWDRYVSMFHFLKGHPQLDALGDGGTDFSEFMQSKAVRGYRRHQHTFLVDERGQLLVDFVAHFEDLQRGFDHVQRVLGIRGRLPRRNRSHHRDFRSYYTPRLWKIVARRCREDIRLFGYEPMVDDPYANVAPTLPAPRYLRAAS